jgi:glyoxylase-like metal-dependent hydrolase (beta-lactamase superfamily II)
MKVQMFTVGALFTNCYVSSCEKTKEAVIIDPGFDDYSEAERIFKYIDTNALKLRYIVDTHGHPDHTCGNGSVRERFHVPILIHEGDAHLLGESGRATAEFFGFQSHSPAPDRFLHEGDCVKLGNTTLKVIHTPGHSAGGISLVGDKEVFTGDTLFAGSIGRTDFPESSEDDMMRSLKKLADLPDDFVAYPGHGPVTTIGEEKRCNPFLQRLGL